MLRQRPADTTKREAGSEPKAASVAAGKPTQANSRQQPQPQQQQNQQNQNQPTRTAMLQNGRKRIHATYPDGRECIEEFCARTDDLLLRKWRKKTALGAWGEWEYEVGEPPRLVVAAGGRASSGGSGLSGAGSGPSLAASDVLLAESATNPVVVRKDTRSHFVWRIRNLPWPKSTYSVSLDESASRIVVRTSNRKYFVRLAVADMERAGLPLQDTSLAFDWGSNTLVVMYAKPAKMLEIEQRYREERQRMLTGSGEAPPKEGDVQCNPS